MVLKDSYWPASSDAVILDSTAGDSLRAAAAAVPHRVALVEGLPDSNARRRWTYAELLHQSERVGQALLTHFKPGDHIAVWAPNSPEWIFVQYGIALAGMVLVTVNPAYRQAELTYVLRQSRAAAVFYAPSFRGHDMRATLTAAAADLPALAERIGLDELTAFLDSAKNNCAWPNVSSDDAVMIQYTSGTTGFPKGALLSHRGVTNNARISAGLRGAGTGTIDVTAMPLFHTGGCVVSVMGTHQTQGTLILMPEFEPNQFLDLIAQERVQFTLAVPTMLIALLEAQRATPRDLSSLEVVISGGAVVPIEIVNRIKSEFGVEFSIIFGQTETSPIVTMTRLDDSPQDTAESLGLPLPGCAVKITDVETGAIVPIGVPGEFCTRGFLTMKEYFDMPEASARTLDAEGWLHTGDLCAMDARGYSYVKGRLKDMIIRGGENIYPREIEDVLFGHPAIAEVAVVGIPDQRWGEQVAAFVRLRGAQQPATSELQEFVREHLAPHKTPRLWIRVDSYPLTPSGKIQKYRLAEMFTAGELTANMN